jgi:hypothetical protein
MTEAERPSFGAAEVIEIISKLETDDDAFIIGRPADDCRNAGFRAFICGSYVLHFRHKENMST